MEAWWRGKTVESVGEQAVKHGEDKNLSNREENEPKDSNRTPRVLANSDACPGECVDDGEDGPPTT